MTIGVVRARLYALRLEREAAELGRALLDDKREAILRTLLEHRPRHAAARARVEEHMRRATASLDAARLDLGKNRLAAAALAQPPAAAVRWRPGSVVGVPTPRLDAEVPAFAPNYAPAALAAKLDEAGADFSAVARAVVVFAEEEEAVRNLQHGLIRTVRRLRALEQVLIPRLDRDLRAVAVTLEEEERDDIVRHRQAGAFGRDSWPGNPSETS